MAVDVSFLLRACEVAARQHRGQRRKDAAGTPYINHPLQVAEILARVAGVRDLEVLAAAVLHDVVEDTGMTVGDLKEQFGEQVAGLVAECSDDKALPKAERKRLQIVHAAALSREARLIKLADKTSNVGDTVDADWEAERIAAYLDWAEAVVKGLRGVNGALDEAFDEAMGKARGRFDASKRWAK